MNNLQIKSRRRAFIIVIDVLLVVMVILSVIFMVIAINAPDGRVRVTVNDSGKSVVCLLRKKEPTVKDAFDVAAVKLFGQDAPSRPLADKVSTDMEVSLSRAFPVSVSHGGGTRVLRVTGGTVGHALRLANIDYKAEDHLSRLPFEDVAPGMHIRFVDVETDYETQLRTLDYEEVTLPDTSRYIGDNRVKTKGVDGQKQVTIRIVSQDGHVVSREIADQTVLKKAVDQVTIVGKKIRYQTNFKNDTRLWKPKPTADQIKKELSYEVTAYTHTGNRTSTGRWPKLGTIAVNPKLIPYGTKIYVPGYGYGRAEDTGGFRHRTDANGNPKMQIDIFLDTVGECNRWGRKRNVKIYLLK